MADPESSAEGDVKKARSSYRIVEAAKDFDSIVKTRPDFNHSNNPIEVTKSPNPS